VCQPFSALQGGTDPGGRAPAPVRGEGAHRPCAPCTKTCRPWSRSSVAFAPAGCRV